VWYHTSTVRVILLSRKCYRIIAFSPHSIKFNSQNISWFLPFIQTTTEGERCASHSISNETNKAFFLEGQNTISRLIIWRVNCFGRSSIPGSWNASFTNANRLSLTYKHTPYNTFITIHNSSAEQAYPRHRRRSPRPGPLDPQAVWHSGNKWTDRIQIPHAEPGVRPQRNIAIPSAVRHVFTGEFHSKRNPKMRGRPFFSFFC
jgi:hypothetical protein